MSDPLTDNPGGTGEPVGFRRIVVAVNIKSWDQTTHYLVGLENDEQIMVIALALPQMRLLAADVAAWLELHGEEESPASPVVLH